MPRVDIWIRKEDWDKWQAIENKPEWLHEHLNNNYLPKADVERAIKEEILGCDGYEKEADSIHCQWCGDTEFSSNHAKARVFKSLGIGEGE